VVHRLPPREREIKEKLVVVAMDIIGPMPRTEKGNEYILSIVDLHTRWAEAVPLKTATSEEIAHALIKEWISRYGVPMEILTDQGPNMIGAVMRQCLQEMSIRAKRSSPEHPAANGAVERFNGTIGRILTRLVLENQMDWDDVLPFALQAYRANHHRIMDMSPAEALYGQRLRTLVDVILPELLTTNLSHVPYHMMSLVEQRAKQADIQQQVRRNLESEQQRLMRNEGDYPVFLAGTRVWIYHPARIRQKLEAAWKGPAEVIKQTSPVNVLIREPLGNGSEKTHILHVSRLKACIERKPRRTDFPEVLLWDSMFDEEQDSDLVGQPSADNQREAPEEIEGRLYYVVEGIVGHMTTKIRTSLGKFRRVIPRQV